MRKLIVYRRHRARRPRRRPPVAIAAGIEPSTRRKHQHWHFTGPFGTYDRAAAQRGYQVYHEVCAACHSLSLLAYRNLMELGLTENQVKGLIKDIQVPDLSDDGQPIERPARLSDPLQEAVPQRGRRGRRQQRQGRRPTSASSSRRARAGRTTSTRCSPATCRSTS